MQDSPATNNWNFRHLLAGTIAGFVILGSIALGIVGIWFAIRIAKPGDNENGLQVLQYVFGVLLPLWGTWIGTILAYYFSKENFESANKNVRDLVTKMTSDEKLGQIKVTEGMIPYQTFETSSLTVNSADTLNSTKVVDMINKLEKLGRQRLPVLVGKQVYYIFHKGALLEYLFKKDPDSNDTIKDMGTKGTQWIKDILTKGVQFLGQEDSMLTAKRLMESEAACNDVMITSNGQRDGIVIGWITDKIISEKAKV